MPAMAFGGGCRTGFDAQLIAATDREQKRRDDIAASFLAASRLLPRLQPHATCSWSTACASARGRRGLVANCGEAVPGTLRPRLPLDAADGLLHVLSCPGAVSTGAGAECWS